MKVVADDKIPFLKGVLEPYAEVIYLSGNKISKKDLLDADALITRTRTICDENLLSGTKVKFIGTATIGYDHIDTSWCEKNGIFWTNAPGCNSGSVYQYIASVIVSLVKKYGLKFSEITLGVIGIGNVGKKIVNLANCLGIKVLQNDPPRERTEGGKDFVSLENLIKSSNIITCHVPLDFEGTDKTFHLFDERLLKTLNSNTILINSSRGEVVDNKALKQVLSKKNIKAAVLDVWEDEPDIDGILVDLLDIVTPHIAGYSLDGKANGTSMIVRFLSKFFNLPLVNWETKNIPNPEIKELTINCEDKSFQEVVSEAILFTYDVISDDKRLRQSLETFEKQRGDYPVRREFGAYSIKLEKSNSEIEKALKNLGFKIV